MRSNTEPAAKNKRRRKRQGAHDPMQEAEAGQEPEADDYICNLFEALQPGAGESISDAHPCHIIRGGLRIRAVFCCWFVLGGVP